MKKTHVSFTEFGRITKEVSSLDEIGVGEFFISVRPSHCGAGSNWPIYEKTATGHRPPDPKLGEAFPDFHPGHTFHKVIG